MSSIRKAQIAGTFYPADPKELESHIKKMLSCHHDLGIDNICGLVVPHAGYFYSGKIAAHAYRQIANHHYDNIFVISPSHYDYFEGCSIFEGNYETPLGVIETNISLIESLSKNDIITISHLGHQNEHALEIQLPFLQLLIPGFKLIPIVMGTQSAEFAEKLSKTIHTTLELPEYKDQKNLIVSSTDLSHFYNVEQAKALDSVIIKDIKNYDMISLNQNILEKKTEACGFGPALTGMITSKLLGATNSIILSYGTSADSNKDLTQVVGYVSALFYRN